MPSFSSVLSVLPHALAVSYGFQTYVEIRKSRCCFFKSDTLRLSEVSKWQMSSKKKKVFLFFRILKCPGWKAAKTSSGCQKFCCRDGQISRVANRSSERGKMLITWPAGGSTCYWWQVKGWRNENRFNGIKCVVNLDENPATLGCLELASHSCIHPFDLSWFIISPPTFMRSVV